MGHDFTQKQCIKALLRVGFTDASKRRGKHFKFKPPTEYTQDLAGNVKPFITVPKHDFYCQNAIVREVARLCGEEVKEKFLKSL